MPARLSFNPTIDRLAMKTPVAANFERGQNTLAQHAVNRRGVNVEISGDFLDREEFGRGRLAAHGVSSCAAPGDFFSDAAHRATRACASAASTFSAASC